MRNAIREAWQAGRAPKQHDQAVSMSVGKGLFLGWRALLTGGAATPGLGTTTAAMGRTRRAVARSFTACRLRIPAVVGSLAGRYLGG
jgi:hypothetical protein